MSTDDQSLPRTEAGTPATSPIEPRGTNLPRSLSEPVKVQAAINEVSILQPLTPIDPERTMVEAEDPDKTMAELVEGTSGMNVVGGESHEEGGGTAAQGVTTHPGLPESSNSIEKKWKDAEACYTEQWADGKDGANEIGKQDMCVGGVATKTDEHGSQVTEKEQKEQEEEQHDDKREGTNKKATSGEENSKRDEDESLAERVEKAGVEEAQAGLEQAIPAPAVGSPHSTQRSI